MAALHEPAGIAHRAKRSAMLMLGYRGCFVAGTFLQQIVLARWLGPADFGIVGICTLVMTFALVITEPGLTSSFIQMDTIREEDFNSLWTVLLLRGVLLTAIFFMLAGVIAHFFHEPRVTPVLRVLSLIFLIDSIKNPAFLMLKRELEYSRIVLQQLLELVVRLGLSAILAIVTGSVWAIVVGMLAGSCVTAIASFALRPYRPRLAFDRTLLGSASRFGRWVTANNVIGYFISYADNLTVGRMLGPTALGYYQYSYRLANLPTTEVSNVVADVAFPAFSRLRDRAAVGAAFVSTMRLTCFVTLPLAGGLAVIAPHLIPVLLGNSWSPMVPTLQILAIWGGIRAIAANAGPLFTGLGQPHIQARQALGRLAIMVALLIPATREWGIKGAASAVLISSIALLPITLAICIKLTGCPARELLRSIAIPTLNTLGMTGALLVMQRQLNLGASVTSLVLQCSTGALLYLGLSEIWSKRAGYLGLRSLLQLLRGALPATAGARS